MGIREDITDNVSAFIRRVTGLSTGNVIPANVGGPRPTLPYVTVLIVSQVDGYQPYQQQKLVDDEPVEVIESDNSYRVSVQAFGDDAFGILETVRHGSSSEDAIRFNTENGIQIQDVGAVVDGSIYLQTSFEDRAILDIIVGYKSRSYMAAVVPVEEVAADINDGDTTIDVEIN